ncbi:hypothetical protein ACB286_04040 [Enterobacter cloacae]
MSNIDKHAVQAVADLKAGYTLGHADVAILNELARIALASLEAEPVHQVYGNNDDTWSDVDEEEMIRLRSDREDTRTLYTAPPAPVSVMDEDLLHMAASAIEDLLSNEDRSGAGVWADVPAKLRCAAMLQGAENAESTTTMQTAPALDSSPKIAESTSGNSPVIPDEVLSAVRKVACIREDFDDFDGDRRGIGDCLDEAEQELIVTINKYASVIAAAQQQEAE